MKVTQYNPDRDIPDQAGKVIVVTGGTSGLGRETVLALAKHHPSQLIFTGRSAQRGAAVIEAAKTSTPDAAVTFVECDLSSLAAVQTAAQQILASSARVDVLMCNAGIMNTPPALSKDGYEAQFGTNHVGHALLTTLLLPRLLETAKKPGGDARIVFLTSLGFGLHPKDGVSFATLRTDQAGLGGGWRCYGQSKLANILYAKELAKRYPEITSVSVHPGVVETELLTDASLLTRIIVYATSYWGMLKPAQGAYNQLWAATANKDDIVNGAFYEPVAVPGRSDKMSSSDDLARELWDWTEKELTSYKA